MEPSPGSTSCRSNDVWYENQINHVRKTVYDNIKIVMMEAQQTIFNIIRVRSIHNSLNRTTDGQEALAKQSEQHQKEQQTGLEHDSPISIEKQKWPCGVQPLKSPYYPQLGDYVVYFRQGHKAYLDAVKTQKLYDVDESDEPWTVMDNKAHEFLKVVQVSYVIQPLRLCCVRLERIDEAGDLTGECFDVRYRDVAGVVDFLILRQSFFAAFERNWWVGSKFRCLIGNDWFFGKIMAMQALDPQRFPESQFKRLRIRWDDDQKVEEVSPWEIEPVNKQRLPEKIEDTVPVLLEEIRKMLYRPEPEEWPDDGREAACQRFLRGLDDLLQLPIAKPFIDLNADPSYASVVKYPIDLSTIEARLENLYYRRIDALKFDVEFLAKNIEEIKDNAIKVKSLSKKMKPDIFTACKMVIHILLKIIEDPNEHNIDGTYENLLDSQEHTDSSDDAESTYSPSESPQSQSQSVPFRSVNLRTTELPWKKACQEILNDLWKHEDSIPFRVPVDPLEYPDYYKVITVPMDLGTIREDFESYGSPLQFDKDMSLIFWNSTKYTSNKEAEIYKLTTRLKKLYDDRIKNIISLWKSSRKSSNSNSHSAMTKKRPSKCDVENMSKKIDDTQDAEAVNPRKKKRRVSNVEAGPSSGYIERNEEESDIDDGTSITRNRSRYLVQESRKEQSKPYENDSESYNNFTEKTTTQNNVKNEDEGDDFQEENSSMNFTPSDELNRIQPGNKSIKITGQVVHVKCVPVKDKTLYYLTFIVDNDDGVRVQCEALVVAAQLHEIKKNLENSIIQIIEATACSASSCNDGNTDYILHLDDSSEIKLL